MKKGKKMMKNLLIYMLCLMLAFNGSMTALAEESSEGGEIGTSAAAVCEVCQEEEANCVCEQESESESEIESQPESSEAESESESETESQPESSEAESESESETESQPESSEAESESESETEAQPVQEDTEALENVSKLLPAGAEIPADCTKVYSVVNAEVGFEVNVCAPEGALPEGAVLVI